MRSSSGLAGVGRWLAPRFCVVRLLGARGGVVALRGRGPSVPLRRQGQRLCGWRRADPKCAAGRRERATKRSVPSQFHVTAIGKRPSDNHRVCSRRAAWDNAELEERLLAVSADPPAGSPTHRDAKCALPSTPLRLAWCASSPLEAGFVRVASLRDLLGPRSLCRSDRALEDAKGLLYWLLQVDPRARPQSMDLVLQHEFLGGPGQPKHGQPAPQHLLAAPAQGPFRARVPSLRAEPGPGSGGAAQAQAAAGASWNISALSSLRAAAAGYLYDGAAKAGEVLQGWAETTGAASALASGAAGASSSTSGDGAGSIGGTGACRRGSCVRHHCHCALLVRPGEAP